MYKFQHTKPILFVYLNLISLLPSSVMLPVPDPYQRIKKSIEAEPVYLPYLNSQDVGVEADQGVDQSVEEQSELESPAISVDTSETLRKINPLTIADQVSNMLRKENGGSTATNERPAQSQNPPGPGNSQRLDVDPNNLADNVIDKDALIRAIQKNSASPVSSPQRTASRDQQEMESPGSSKNLDPSAGKSAEIPEGYECQESPKIVNKPRPKDNAGYSVIVMAGDSVKFPIKVDSKPKKSQEKQESAVRDICSSALGPVVAGPSRSGVSGNLRRGEAENKKHLREKNSKKEFRVSKQYGKYPDFPVYDEDFNFVPDPFQGVLDENYWKDVDKNGVQKLAVPMDSYKIGEFGFEPHNILMRSNDDNGANSEVDNGIQACGGGGVWRRKNSTEVVTD